MELRDFQIYSFQNTVPHRFGLFPAQKKLDKTLLYALSSGSYKLRLTMQEIYLAYILRVNEPRFRANDMSNQPTNTDIYIYIYIYIYTHTHTHACLHTYKHTHT